MPPGSWRVARHLSCKDVLGTLCSTRLTPRFKNRTVRKRKDGSSAGCQAQEMCSFNPGSKTPFDLLVSRWRASDTEGRGAVLVPPSVSSRGRRHSGGSSGIKLEMSTTFKGTARPCGRQLPVFLPGAKGLQESMEIEGKKTKQVLSSPLKFVLCSVWRARHLLSVS